MLPLTLADIFAMHADFARDFTQLFSKNTISPCFGEIYVKLTKNVWFQPRQLRPFLSVRSSRRTKRTVPASLRRMSDPKLSRFEYAGPSRLGALCWKSTVISSRSLRRLMSRKSPWRPSGKSCHKNASTRRWQTSHFTKRLTA